MKLDLTPLENAVAQLEDSLVQYESDIVRRYPMIQNQMRAGAIQAFEVTYELSVKMMRRYLEQISANPAEVDQLDFRNLLRMAMQQELLHSEPDAWIRYRADRGATSHAYNEARAERVFQGILEFLREARHLLKGLQEKNERLD
ncbi:MAG: HI0074 family nucleotidyltransferase substrate-binding subunit [Chloroflexi bacterium]|nr:HI0074 family nucleotidyltransferase substrate-binding subunit [Chloroflexota bacterium]MCY3958702.1 HI0074 family nucleotidyltransferase substrate-binding subunit [Chloroflexota bacterium]